MKQGLKVKKNIVVGKTTQNSGDDFSVSNVPPFLYLRLL